MPPMPAMAKPPSIGRPRRGQKPPAADEEPENRADVDILRRLTRPVVLARVESWEDSRNVRAAEEKGARQTGANMERLGATAPAVAA